MILFHLGALVEVTRLEVGKDYVTRTVIEQGMRTAEAVEALAAGRARERQQRVRKANYDVLMDDSYAGTGEEHT